MPSLDELIARGNQLLNGGSYLKAEEVLRQAYRIDGENREVLIGLSICSKARGDHPGALVYLREALASNESDTEIQQMAGVFEYLCGHFARAATEFRRILQIDAKDIDAAAYLGLCLVRLGEVDEARKTLEGVLTRDSSKIAARVGMIILQSANTEEGARRCVELVKEVNEEDGKLALALVLTKSADEDATR
jgi:Flp pilus assembly protein TadD